MPGGSERHGQLQLRLNIQLAYHYAGSHFRGPLFSAIRQSESRAARRLAKTMSGVPLTADMIDCAPSIADAGSTKSAIVKVSRTLAGDGGVARAVAGVRETTMHEVALAQVVQQAPGATRSALRGLGSDAAAGAVGRMQQIRSPAGVRDATTTIQGQFCRRERTLSDRSADLVCIVMLDRVSCLPDGYRA